MTNLSSSRPASKNIYQVKEGHSQRIPLFCGCGFVPALALAIVIGVLTAIYFFAPGRTNIIILGVDFTGENSSVGRSDTNVLATIDPGSPYVGTLSIPRDLWVPIPGFGENRINTAHFFAEASESGSGPTKVKETIRSNFGVDVDFYLRLNFEGFKRLIDAMGGVSVDLPRPMAGYEAGSHWLSGKKALAFARNRSGTDDFFRMEQGQLLIKSVFKQLLSPLSWPRLPAEIAVLPAALDSDIPFWLWPRLLFTILSVGPDHIDSRVFGREMVTPYTTNQGASVLLPNWQQINPVLYDMFGQ